MPKAINYRPNSIIYFKGDASDRIFVLNSGKVSLNYLDIETGQEMRDLINTGEFFGVKSAMGRYSRDETAVVLQNTTVIAFTVAEFEQVVSKNIRVIMKMLKVFSNQLRRIHNQVQNMLTTDQHADPEDGLFQIGEYYLKNRRHSQAQYAYKRYLTYYPSGKYAVEATERLANSDPSKPKPRESLTLEPAADQPMDSGTGQEGPDPKKKYFDAINLMKDEKHAEALPLFKEIIQDGSDGEYFEKALFEIGRCQFALEQYADCMKTYQALVQKFPQHKDLNAALLYVGRCNEATGDAVRAGKIYEKILSMADKEDPAYRDARRALAKLKGT